MGWSARGGTMIPNLIGTAFLTKSRSSSPDSYVVSTYTSSPGVDILRTAVDNGTAVYLHT